MKKHKYLIGLHCISLFIVILLLIQVSTVTVYADQLINSDSLQCVYKHEYQPAHIALLMDASGSIAGKNVENASDPQLYSRDLAKAVTENLPLSPDNQVALFSYNTSCYQICDFTPIDTSASIIKLNEELDNMKDTRGDTHIFDAVRNAREALDRNHKDGVKDIIILFTDGAEDSDEIDPDTVVVDESFRTFVKSKVQDIFRDSDVIVYAVGSDHASKDKNGNIVHSISGNTNSQEKAYGEVILDELTSYTGGQTIVTPSSVRDLNGAFTDAVNSICFREPLKVTSQDGHFKISPSVKEVNVRIFSENEGTLEGIPILLTKPSGETITLTTDMKDGDILFFSDRLAANCKLIAPDSGEWSIDLSGAREKQNIEICVMEQYNIGMTTTYRPDDKKLCKNDTILVESTLLVDGVKAPKSLYDGIEAKLFICSEGHDIDALDMSAVEYDNYLESKGLKKNVDFWDMEINDSSISKEITLANEGTQTLGIWVDAPLFTVLMSKYSITVDHASIQLKNRIKNQCMVNGDPPLLINDLHSYCNMDDAIISLNKIDDSVASLVLDNNDTLKISPVGPGRAEIELFYQAADGLSTTNMKFVLDITNSPPHFIRIPDPIEVKVDKVVSIENLEQYVKDIENDPLHFSVKDYSGGGITNAIIVDNSTLQIKGVMSGDETITIAVDDGNGVIDTVDIKVKVSLRVIDWFKIIMMILAACIGIGTVLFIIHQGRRKLTASLRRVRLDLGDKKEILLMYNAELRQLFRKSSECESVTVDRLINRIIEKSSIIQREDKTRIYSELRENFDAFMSSLKDLHIEGTTSRRKPNPLKGGNAQIYVNNRSTGRNPVLIALDRSIPETTVTIEYRSSDDKGDRRFSLVFEYGKKRVGGEKAHREFTRSNPKTSHSKSKNPFQ